MQATCRLLRRLFFELKDILIALIDEVVPRLSAEQAFYCLEESFGVKVKQLRQRLFICHKVDDVEGMRLKLDLIEFSTRELFTLQEEA